MTLFCKASCSCRSDITVDSVHSIVNSAESAFCHSVTPSVNVSSGVCFNKPESVNQWVEFDWF